jgi:hypothetical protein
MSMCPPGAIRLVPTLMTTRIVCRAAAGTIYFSFAVKKLQPVPGSLILPAQRGETITLSCR